jgi:amino acid transporter
VSLALVGLLVPYTDPHLIGSSGSDAHASPFVIAITNSAIAGLDSVMNVVIMIAVLSVGNSSIYGSSRTLAALAEQGQAPRFLSYIDRRGRPLMAVLVASSVGFLAYIAASDQQDAAFTWMLAISGLSSILTWASICLSHIRFRQAWALQGHSVDELAFRSQAGVVGSYIGFAFNLLVLAAQFWTGFAPVGFRSKTPAENTANFFQAYLAAPIVLAFYIPYKLYYRTPFMKCRDMDLQTGMRELNLAELLAEERAEQAVWPQWKRLYKLFC